MMPNYENETCEGCRYYEMVNDLGLGCMDPDTIVGKQMVDPGFRCDHFAPSLECRKVRALESIDRKFNPPPIEAIIGQWKDVLRDELSAHVKEMIAAERECVVCGGAGAVNVDCGCFSMDGADPECEDCNGDGTIEIECPECNE
jgi:hypothetical protein